MSEVHTTPSERLVMMANQIARAFAAQGEDRAVQKTAEHIKAFWDPRMRRKIAEHVAAGGEGLEPYALAALQRLIAGSANATSPTRDAVPSAAEHRDDRGADARGRGRWWSRLPGTRHSQ